MFVILSNFLSTIIDSQREQYAVVTLLNKFCSNNFNHSLLRYRASLQACLY